MDLYTLAKFKAISLKITTVDMKRPPPDFRDKYGDSQPPILLANGIPILDNDLVTIIWHLRFSLVCYYPFMYLHVLQIESHITDGFEGGQNLLVEGKKKIGANT